MSQVVYKQIGTSPAVEPELHFLQVGFKMLSRNPMPRADDAPLQKGKSGLGGVCMDFAVNVDLCSVLDGLVPPRESNRLHCAEVGIEFIGHPTGRKIEREEAFALLQLFPSYCDVSYVVITWLNGKTI